MDAAFISALHIPNIPITIGSVPYRPPPPAQFPPPGAALTTPSAPPLAEFEGASAYPPAATQYGGPAQKYPNIG